MSYHHVGREVSPYPLRAPSSAKFKLLHPSKNSMTASNVVADFLKTFKDFPPRQKARSFTIDQAMEKMERAASGD